MKQITSAIMLLFFAVGLLLTGCGPSHEQMTLAKSMAARTDNQPTYNESARFIQQTYCNKHDKDFVMWDMNYASLCLMGGNYDAAKKEMLKCYEDISRAADKDKETAAALSNEGLKLFKGEPFERAMLCCYLGLLYYMDGDYNNARIFFAQADMQDATTEEDMKDYRNDFQLAHYWLGRTYLQLGQKDNARIAFAKASQRIPRKNEERELSDIQSSQAQYRQKMMRLEAQSYKNACSSKPPVAGAADMSASPAESELPEAFKEANGENPVELAAKDATTFFSEDYQKEVNLILVIETGISPIKFLTGPSGCMDAIMRMPYAERKVAVYLDGHKAGPAVQLIDLFHQADTRGTSDKDKAQMAKGVSKTIMDQLPYVSYASQYWDVQADSRYWSLLPGEVHIFAAKVKPGVYTVNIQCLDSNNYLLPRYSLTSYFIPVREGRENIYMLHTKPEADNCYVSPKQQQYYFADPFAGIGG